MCQSQTKQEIKMSNLRTSKINKLVAAVLSVATITAVLATTTTSASAFPRHGHHHGRAWAYGAGGLALGLLGAAAVSQSYGYAYGRSCYMQRQYDEDGNYMGRSRVCRRAYVD